MQKKAPSQRQLRVSEEIKKLIAKMLIENNLFIKGLKAPYLMLTEVQVAPDFSYATLFVRAMPKGLKSPHDQFCWGVKGA